MKTIMKHSAVAIVMASLAACGGSSGGSKKVTPSSAASTSSLVASSPASSAVSLASEASVSSMSTSAASDTSASSLPVSSTGQSSSTSSSAAAQARVGVFLDSAVWGIHYATSPSGKTGTTTSTGQYEYEDGDTVTFRIGDLTLPATLAKGVVTPTDLALVDNEIDNNIQLNILRLLQTLDKDNNPNNGIAIDQAGHDLFSGSQTVDFSASASVFASTVEPLIDTTLVTANDALNHFTHTLHSQLLGSWVYSEGQGKRNVLTFIDKTHYIIIHEHDDGDSQTAGSVEYGEYLWEPISGDVTFEGIEDSDNSGGLWSREGGSSVTAMRFDGHTVRLTITDEPDAVFTKVHDQNNPLVGAWLLNESEPSNINILTFLSSTEYVIAHTNNAEDYSDQPNQPLSGEFGTFTLSETGAFLVTGASVDTDGEGGLFNKNNSNDQANETITITSWGDLTFTDDDEGTFSFERIGYFEAIDRDMGMHQVVGGGIVARDRSSTLLDANLLTDHHLNIRVPLFDGTTSVFDFRFNDDGSGEVYVNDEDTSLAFEWNLGDTSVVNIALDDDNEQIYIVLAPVLSGSSDLRILMSIRGFFESTQSEDSLWHTKVSFLE